MATVIRSAAPGDVPDIAEMVEAGFAAATAAHIGAEGQRVFRRFSAADAISGRLSGTNEGWVALHDDRIVGYAEMDGDHLRMIFVHPDTQGRGLGRKLLGHVLEQRRGRTVTVNSAPNADGFYRHMGFRPTGPQQERNGILFTPMECPA